MNTPSQTEHDASRQPTRPRPAHFRRRRVLSALGLDTTTHLDTSLDTTSPADVN